MRLSKLFSLYSFSYFVVFFNSLYDCVVTFLSVFLGYFCTNEYVIFCVHNCICYIVGNVSVIVYVCHRACVWVFVCVSICHCDNTRYVVINNAKFTPILKNTETIHTITIHMIIQAQWGTYIFTISNRKHNNTH